MVSNSNQKEHKYFSELIGDSYKEWEKWLYADDRKYLTKKFEAIGIKMRTPGINALNGALQDVYKEKYKCRFRNKQLDENGELTKKNLVDKRRKLEDGSINMNRNKTYWILE